MKTPHPIRAITVIAAISLLHVLLVATLLIQAADVVPTQPDSLPDPPYTYRGTVLRVIDGDTLVVDIDLGFDTHYHARLRLNGVDAPEMRGPEREQGLDTKAAIEALVARPATPVSITSRSRDKYGRWLATVQFIHNGKLTDLSRYLLDNKLAVPYP